MVTHYMLRTHEEKWVFSGKNIRFVAALDVIKCLEQVERQILRLTCAPLNELPSNISIMPPISLYQKKKNAAIKKVFVRINIIASKHV